jgi:hypothetical protein
VIRFKSVKSALFILSLLTTCDLLPAAVFAQQNIGSVTTIKKEVRVVHPGQTQVAMVKSGDGVLFLDSYETLDEARAKLLFEDDSLLTLGEKTRLQITENVYNPSKNRRSTALKMLSGRLRVLVGKTFTGTGSKFEVHTPTAVAAARGTYYIVWLFKQKDDLLTGVVSLADRVDVHNVDPNVSGTVFVGPNQYTIVAFGKPPTPAAPIDPSLLAELLSSTDLSDEWVEPIPFPIELPAVLGGVIPLSPQRLHPAVHLPSIPPIDQQSGNNTTPVNMEIEFP